MPIFGEVDTSDFQSAAYFNNIRQYRYHCICGSGIARYIRLRVTDVVSPGGETDYETIIGIAENTRARRKLPPVSGIRKLMEMLETDEAPKWYIVSDDSY